MRNQSKSPARPRRRRRAASERGQRDAGRLGRAGRSAAVAHARQRHGDSRPGDRGEAAIHPRRGAASVPGLTLQQNGGPGTVTSLFTRGGESDFTLVLVDGIRANSFGGGIDLSQLPLQDVDRIEVLRGSQSALYGSDAIGGVVSVITRTGGSPSAQAQLEAGSRDMWRASGATTGEVNGVRWQLGATHFKTPASPARPPTARPYRMTMRGRRRRGRRSAGAMRRADPICRRRCSTSTPSVDRRGPYGSDPAPGMPASTGSRAARRSAPAAACA